jgi:hypothetical protein
MLNAGCQMGSVRRLAFTVHRSAEEGDSASVRRSIFFSRLNATRAAAERFLAKALSGANHPAPRVINTDKHAGYPPTFSFIPGSLAYDRRLRSDSYESAKARRAGVRQVAKFGLLHQFILDLVAATS